MADYPHFEKSRGAIYPQNIDQFAKIWHDDTSQISGPISQK